MSEQLRQMFRSIHPAAWRAHPDPSAAPVDLLPRLATADLLDEHGRSREAAILRDTRRHAYLDFGGRVEDAGELVQQLNDGFNPRAVMDTFTDRYVRAALAHANLGPHPETGGLFRPEDVTHQTLAAMIADAHHFRAVHEGVDEEGDRLSSTTNGERLFLSRANPAVRAANEPWFGGFGWPEPDLHKQLHDYAKAMGPHPLQVSRFSPVLVSAERSVRGYVAPHPQSVPLLPPDPPAPPPEDTDMNIRPNRPVPYAAPPAPQGTYRYTPLPPAGGNRRGAQQQAPAAYDDAPLGSYPAYPGMADPYLGSPVGQMPGQPATAVNPWGQAPGGAATGPATTPPFAAQPPNPAPDGYGHTDPMGHQYAQYADAPPPDDDYDDHYPPEEAARMRARDAADSRDRGHAESRRHTDADELAARRNRRQMPPGYARYENGPDDDGDDDPDDTDLADAERQLTAPADTSALHDLMAALTQAMQLLEQAGCGTGGCGPTMAGRYAGRTPYLGTALAGAGLGAVAGGMMGGPMGALAGGGLGASLGGLGASLGGAMEHDARYNGPGCYDEAERIPWDRVPGPQGVHTARRPLMRPPLPPGAVRPTAGVTRAQGGGYPKTPPTMYPTGRFPGGRSLQAGRYGQNVVPAGCEGPRYRGPGY